MTVLYGSNVSDANLTSASSMSTTTGGTETSATTTVSGTNPYAEVYSRSASETSVTSAPAPDGKGWVYKPGAGVFELGNWSATITLSCSAPGTTDVTLRIYKYNGSYSAIGTINKTGIVATKTAYSFAATSMPLTSFLASDLLYFDLIWHDTSGADDAPVVYISNSATVGVASDFKVTTNTFSPGVSFTENLTAAESVLFQPDFLPTETGTIVESATETENYSPTDTGSVSDLFSGTENILTTDQLNTIESATETGNFLPLDALTEQEIASYQVAPALQESGTVNEIFVAQITLPATDTATILELLAVLTNTQQSDALTALENATFLLALTATDLDTIGDLLTFVAYFSANLVDITLSCTDLLAVTEIALQTDALTFLDSLQNNVNFSVADNGVISEQIGAIGSISATDTGNVTENFLETCQYSPIDTASLQEMVQNSVNVQIIDIALSVQEIAALTTTFLTQENMLIFDAMTLLSLFAPIDTNILLEMIALSVSLVLSDLAATPTDLFASTINFVSVENLTIIELLTVSEIDVVSFVETLSVSDTLQPTLLYQAYLEIWPVSEQFSYLVSVQENEQNTPIESVFYELFSQTTDPLAMTEQFSVFCFITFTEIMASSDLVIGMPQFGATEMLVSFDSLSMSLTQIAQDGLNLSDLGAFLPIIGLFDTGVSNDLLAAFILTSRTEQLSALEVLLPTIENISSDSVVLLEAPTWQGAILVSENAPVSENSSFIGTLLSSDLLTSNETITLALFYQALEVLQNVELFTPIIGATNSDNVVINESVTLAGSAFPVDQIVGNDSIASIVQQKITEQLIITEQYGASLAVGALEQLSNLTDAVSYGSLFVPVEIIFAQEQWVILLALTEIDIITAIEHGPDLGIHLIDLALVPVDSIAFSLYEFALVQALVRSGKIKATARRGDIEGAVRSGLVKGILE